MARANRLLASFGRFWWEFLVGENPDGFIGALLVIGASLLLRHDRPVAIAVVPVLALVILIASTYRGRKRATD
jgi:hypothetical protein